MLEGVLRAVLLCTLKGPMLKAVGEMAEPLLCALPRKQNFIQFF